MLHYFISVIQCYKCISKLDSDNKYKVTNHASIGGLMIATIDATCLGEISVTQHKLFNSVPYLCY